MHIYVCVLHVTDYSYGDKTPQPLLQCNSMVPSELDWLSKVAITSSSKNFTRSSSSYSGHTTVNGRNGWVEYAIDIPVTGRYHLNVKYNSKESRPLKLIINKTTVCSKFANGTTGTWSEKYKARKDCYGPFEMTKGRNILRLETEGCFPHLLGFGLKPYDATLARVFLSTKPEALRALMESIQVIIESCILHHQCKSHMQCAFPTNDHKVSQS